MVTLLSLDHLHLYSLLTALPTFVELYSSRYAWNIGILTCSKISGPGINSKSRGLELKGSLDFLWACMTLRRTKVKCLPSWQVRFKMSLPSEKLGVPSYFYVVKSFRAVKTVKRRMYVFLLFSAPTQRFLFHCLRFLKLLPFRLESQSLKYPKPNEESG